MSRRRSFLPKLALLLLLAILLAAPLWLGLVPARYLPFRALDISDPDSWFVDFRLAALRQDRETCSAALAPPHAGASAIADKPIERGCGWANAVRLRDAGGVTVSAERITCPMAAALAMWLAHEVQPLATRHLGVKVRSVIGMGTYSCRNIVGNPGLADMRSEHATANAIDIGGFVLVDGRQISVLRHWRSNGPEAAFLREAHRRSCRYFRVSLSPEYNAAHRDHLHLDRGDFWTCR